MEKFLELNPAKLSEGAQFLSDKLRSKVIGQDRAVNEIVHVFQKIQIGLVPPSRPLSVFLFMGPTGSGKTSLVKSLAEILLGSDLAYTRIDCAEYQHSHEIAKLIGAPPGYVGHTEGRARLNQADLDQFQKENFKVNILLLDEIEKAHEALFSLFLGVLDAGKATLGNNAVVDFTRTVVFFTSNLGSKEVDSTMESDGIGFHSPEPVFDKLDNKIYKISKDAAKRFFLPEFINRLDSMIVFRALTPQSLRRILDIELVLLQERMLKSELKPILAFSPKAKEYILVEGTSKVYGAREMKRAIERLVVTPLSSILSSGQIKLGERILIDCQADQLRFLKAKSA